MGNKKTIISFFIKVYFNLILYFHGEYYDKEKF